MAGYGNITGGGSALDITPVRYGNIAPGKAAPRKTAPARGGGGDNEAGTRSNAEANTELQELEGRALDNALKKEALAGVRDERARNRDTRISQLRQEARGGADWQVQERVARGAEDDQNQKRKAAERMKAASQLAYIIDSTKPDKTGNIKLGGDAIPLLTKLVPNFQAQFDENGKLLPVSAAIEGSGEPGSQERVLAFYMGNSAEDTLMTPITTPDGAPVRPNLNNLAILADMAREDERRRTFLPTQGRRQKGATSEVEYKNRLKAIADNVGYLEDQRTSAWERMNELQMADPEAKDPATLKAIRDFDDLNRQYASARDIYGQMAQRADQGIPMGQQGSPGAFSHVQGALRVDEPEPETAGAAGDPRRPAIQPPGSTGGLQGVVEGGAPDGGAIQQALTIDEQIDADVIARKDERRDSKLKRGLRSNALADAEYLKGRMNNFGQMLSDPKKLRAYATQLKKSIQRLQRAGEDEEAHAMVQHYKTVINALGR